MAGIATSDVGINKDGTPKPVGVRCEQRCWCMGRGRRRVRRCRRVRCRLALTCCVLACRRDSFARGMELKARQTILAEGCRGSLSEMVMKQYNLRLSIACCRDGLPSCTCRVLLCAAAFRFRPSDP